MGLDIAGKLHSLTSPSLLAVLSWDTTQARFGCFRAACFEDPVAMFIAGDCLLLKKVSI
jgi:hypothetical protein